mmetsp:Transcript_16994/g.57436  ORF Transcript_16994/g.57436 Transcript_16994/m.57436 type:complete len:84 (-) Transcript_16994:62-313(-)
MYRDGDAGLKKDLKRAVQLFELAAAQGHARGQASLGQCYESGDGVAIDHKAAAHWYRRAADQGYPEAQFILGLTFADGSGPFI